MNFVDLLNNFYVASKERVKNPFLTTLFISWVVINWRAVAFFIYSDLPIESTIDCIDTNYSTGWVSLLLPPIVAFVYVAVLPYLMLLMEWLNSLAKIKRNEYGINIKIASVKVKNELAKEEYKLEATKAGTDEISGLNIKIEQLKGELSSSEKTIENLEDELSNKRQYGTAHPKLSLEEFRKHKKPFQHFQNISSEIRSNSAFPYGTSNQIKNYYLTNNLVIEVENEAGVVFYKMSKLGDEFQRLILNDMFSNDEGEQEQQS